MRITAKIAAFILFGSLACLGDALPSNGCPATPGYALSCDGISYTWSEDIGPYSDVVTIDFGVPVTSWGLQIQLQQRLLPPGSTQPTITAEDQPFYWVNSYTAIQNGTAPRWSSQGITEMTVVVGFPEFQNSWIPVLPQFIRFTNLVDPPAPGTSSITQSDAPEPGALMLTALGLSALGLVRLCSNRYSRRFGNTGRAQAAPALQ